MFLTETLYPMQVYCIKYIDFMVRRCGEAHAQVELTRMCKVVVFLKHNDLGGRVSPPKEEVRWGAMADHDLEGVKGGEHTAIIIGQGPREGAGQVCDPIGAK